MPQLPISASDSTDTTCKPSQGGRLRFLARVGAAQLCTGKIWMNLLARPASEQRERESDLGSSANKSALSCLDILQQGEVEKEKKCVLKPEDEFQIFFNILEWILALTIIEPERFRSTTHPFSRVHYIVHVPVPCVELLIVIRRQSSLWQVSKPERMNEHDQDIFHLFISGISFKCRISTDRRTLSIKSWRKGCEMISLSVT